MIKEVVDALVKRFRALELPKSSGHRKLVAVYDADPIGEAIVYPSAIIVDEGPGAVQWGGSTSVSIHTFSVIFCLGPINQALLWQGVAHELWDKIDDLLVADVTLGGLVAGGINWSSAGAAGSEVRRGVSAYVGIGIEISVPRSRSVRVG